MNEHSRKWLKIKILNHLKRWKKIYEVLKYFPKQVIVKFEPVLYDFFAWQVRQHTRIFITRYN